MDNSGFTSFTTPPNPVPASTTSCDEIDNSILPYFGLNFDEDYLQPCLDEDSFWFFDAPSYEISSELSTNTYPLDTIRIGELELMAALSSYQDWESYIMNGWTETSEIFQPKLLGLNSAIPTLDMDVAGENIAPRDLKQPHFKKWTPNTSPDGQRLKEDMQSVFNWVSRYAKEYYGRQFMVRVPYTCCWADTTTGKTRVSELPTNDGGWSELSTILDLPNVGSLGIGVFDFINFFRDPSGKILPFVKFERGILISTSNLGKDDYFFYYSLAAGGASAAGPPGALGADAVYTDTDTSLIYVYNFPEAAWFLVTGTCILSGNGAPPTSGIKVTCLGIYVDLDTGTIYLNNDATPVLDSATNTYSVSDWLTSDIDLYVKATVQENYVFYDKSNCFTPRVVVELPQAVFAKDQIEYQFSGLGTNFNKFRKGVDNAVKTNKAAKVQYAQGINPKNAKVNIHEAMVQPDACAIPVISTSITYGPWTNPPEGCGRTNVIQDEGLAPWNFGSFLTMNLAGQYLADSARVNMKVGELGSITVPGYPTRPLGAELQSIEGGYYGSNLQLLENRSFTTIAHSGLTPSGLLFTNYGIFSFSDAWRGTHGPNITGLSINIDNNCNVTTNYTMQTFAPKRNALSKWMVEQVQNINTLANQQVDFVRKLIEKQKRERFFTSQTNSLAFSEDKRSGVRAQINAGGSGNEVIVAAEQVHNDKAGDKNYRRTIIANTTMENVSEEMQYGYESKAMMSMDGLLRPTSMDGDGGLSRFGRYKDNITGVTLSNSGQQLTSSGEALLLTTSINGTKIKQDDLVPTTNPTGYDRDWVARKRSCTPEVGHDFDLLGRTGIGPSGTPINGMIMPVAGWNNSNSGGGSDYTNDYRYPVLRGPLLLKSWGYDLDDNPIPNKNDTYGNAISGIFIRGSGTDTDANGSGLSVSPTFFLNDHLRQPQTWPVGPIDLRWDHERGVWGVQGAGLGVTTSCGESGAFTGELEVLKKIECGECGISETFHTLNIVSGLICSVVTDTRLTNCPVSPVCPVLDCSGCCGSFLISIPSATFNGILSCLNNVEIDLIKTLDDPITYSGNPAADASCDWAAVKRPLEDCNGDFGPNFATPSGVTCVADCTCFCSGGNFQGTTEGIDHLDASGSCPAYGWDVFCESSGFAGSLSVDTLGRTCYGCKDPVVSVATQDTCIDGCTYGLYVGGLTASLGCFSGIWELRINGPTPGLCPKVTYDGVAKKAAGSDDGDCPNKCPPTGSWDMVWTIVNACPTDSDPWTTPLQHSPINFTSDVTLSCND